jgi:hypothetical protein
MFPVESQHPLSDRHREAQHRRDAGNRKAAVVFGEEGGHPRHGVVLFSSRGCALAVAEDADQRQRYLDRIVMEFSAPSTILTGFREILTKLMMAPLLIIGLKVTGVTCKSASEQRYTACLIFQNHPNGSAALLSRWVPLQQEKNNNDSINQSHFSDFPAPEEMLLLHHLRG